MDIYEEIYNKNKKLIDIAIEKIKVCEDDPLHFIGHTIDVVNYVKELLEKIPANKEICIIAAYWHDVGRSVTDKEHEEESGRILKEEMNKLGYSNEMIKQCYSAVVNHKRKCIPPTTEGEIVRDADKIAYIGKNRWKRCIEEEAELLDEIIEVYLPILREEILRLEYSKKLFDRDMNLYIKEYIEVIKKNKEVLAEQKIAEIIENSEEEQNNSQNEILEIETEKIEYHLPPLELLDIKINSNQAESRKLLIESVQKLQKILYSFGVKAKVENVSIGPIIKTYEIKLDEGISVNKVKKLKDDLALNLETKIINIKIIPEKQLVGIETERRDKEIVKFGEIIKTEEFENSTSKLTVGLGKDIYGKCKVIDIKKTSHMLISGTTGSGKSMFLHILINSILYKAKPSEVKFIMIDTKVVELSLYNKIPHLLIPVINDRRKALGALAWLCQEMENRYVILANKGIKNIEEYNEKQDNVEKLPDIVLIIDEYADLIEIDKKEIEEYIYVLTQKARVVGIYLIIVTERPSTKIINGSIKANIPTRVAFKLPSQIDSKVVLDTVGAEELLGNGDMFFKEIGIYEPTRCQCAFISNNELEKITNYIKVEEKIIYNEDILQKVDNNRLELEINDDIDPFLMEAIESVVETGQVSTSFIQRRLKIGYARAGRIIDQMEEKGIISGYQGSRPREVLMSIDRWNELKSMNN